MAPGYLAREYASPSAALCCPRNFERTVVPLLLIGPALPWRRHMSSSCQCLYKAAQGGFIFQCNGLVTGKGLCLASCCFVCFRPCGGKLSLSILISNPLFTRQRGNPSHMQLAPYTCERPRARKCGRWHSVFINLVEPAFLRQRGNPSQSIWRKGPRLIPAELLRARKGARRHSVFVNLVEPALFAVEGKPQPQHLAKRSPSYTCGATAGQEGSSPSLRLR